MTILIFFEQRAIYLESFSRVYPWNSRDFLRIYTEFSMRFLHALWRQKKRRMAFFLCCGSVAEYLPNWGLD